jgi:hypothetical protein
MGLGWVLVASSGLAGCFAPPPPPRSTGGALSAGGSMSDVAGSLSLARCSCGGILRCGYWWYDACAAAGARERQQACSIAGVALLGWR